MIDEVGARKVLAVVSDNAANMRAAWAILQSKYEHIYCYSCVAHGLHLLATDVCGVESVSKIIQKAKDIVKFVKYKHVPQAVFQRVQKDRLKQGTPLNLVMPSPTRWGTKALMLKRLLQVQKSLQYMVMEEEIDAIVTPRMKSDILDGSVFWAQVKNLHNLMQPLADAIKRVESDKPCLSDIPQIFYELRQHITQVLPQAPVQKKEKREIQKQLDHIQPAACCTPIGSEILRCTVKRQSDICSMQYNL